MRLRFTASARRQFLSALAYIRRDDPAAARRFRRKAERLLQRLQQFPDSGRLLPEFPAAPHREVVIPPYRFFYRHDGQTVWIVAVWHSAQIPGAPDGDPA